MRKRTPRAAGWLLAVMLFGAAAPAQQPAPPAEPQPQPQPATEERSAGPNIAEPVDPNTYLIGPEDVLYIRVWRENELSSMVSVRPDGRITLALVGDVEAAGLTPLQLAARVTEAYGKILNKPEVMVEVRQVRSKRYYISGNALRTGPQPLITPTTVLQALSSAGFRDWAKTNKIVIMRGTQRLKFNYKDILKGKKLEQNIYLQDGDHIYIP
ncbi:MAG: polysaccharide biosynthesis/export family protein [Bryobacteraceae bacterium]|nr:polysaccharide biosynthesis/export family protein [Bryobacteraceae bacterium]